MASQGRNTYTFTHRLKGETTLRLFDHYYLKIFEKRLGKGRDFKLELAILNPQPIHVRKTPFHWLAAAIVAGLSAIYFIYSLLSATDNGNLWPLLGAAVVAAVLATAFSLLFVFNTERKWVFETRAAVYPLVHIPYRKKDAEKVQGLVQTLASSIGENIVKKGYSNEVLFAGEMRMLRRLAKTQILSPDSYDRAKKHMLEKSGQMGIAS